jgi:hypothetical protein
LTQTSAKPTQGGLGGVPPKKTNQSRDILLFPEKEAKSVSSASQKAGLLTENSAKPTKGVWGLAPSFGPKIIIAKINL